MERRRYLWTIAAVGAGTAFSGCSGGESDDAAPDDTATPLDTNVTADGDPTPIGEPTPTGEPTATGTIPDVPVADSTTGWERRDHYSDAAPDDAPSVEFDPEDDRLYVRGAIAVGSSSCKEAAVQEVEYDDGELYVSVMHDYVETEDGERPRECTADVSTDAYEVEVTFEEGLPARVVAEERDYHAEERRAVYDR